MLMNRTDFIFKFRNIVNIIKNFGGEIYDLKIGKKSTDKELKHLKNSYENLLPVDFLWYIEEFSFIEFIWFFPDEKIEKINERLSFTNKNNIISSGHLSWNINMLLSQDRIDFFNEIRKKTSYKDEYEKNFCELYKNKIEFLDVPNGAAHAIDVINNSIVYLSHDDSDEYIIFLGKNFHEYITNYMNIFFIGSEIWQLENFISKGIGIDPNSKNFLEFKQILNLV